MLAHLSRLLTHHRFVPFCFIVFVAIRVALIFLIPVEMHSDALWYQNRAMNIASGAGYSERGYPTAYWPIGYPGFLAATFFLFGKQAIVGKLANLVLAAGTFFLVLHMTRRVFRDEQAARLALLLLTFYPNNAVYTSLLLTETLFTFLVLLGCCLYLSRRSRVWLLFTGLVFGYAALTKPQVLFLPGFLILFSLLDQGETSPLKRLLLSGVLICAGMAVVLVPWAIRNTIVFNEVVLISTNGGATLLTGNNPSADGGYTPDDPLVKQRKFSVADQVAADRRARAIAIQWIKEHPDRFIHLIPLKLWGLWAKDGEAEWAYQEGYEHYDEYQLWFRGVRVLNQAYYALLLLWFLISVFQIRRHRLQTLWPWSLFGYLLAGYVTIISIVFSGQPRFHFPVMPWVIMHAAWAMSLYLKRRQASHRPATKDILNDSAN